MLDTGSVCVCVCVNVCVKKYNLKLLLGVFPSKIKNLKLKFINWTIPMHIIFIALMLDKRGNCVHMLC